MAQVKKINNTAENFLKVLMLAAQGNPKGAKVTADIKNGDIVFDYSAIAEKIKKQIENSPARSYWQKGVRDFAVDLFNNAAEWILSENYTGEQRDILFITEKDLLNGAGNWNHFSRGGCWLVYDGDIAKALCTPSELKRTKNGYLPPNSQEDWLDVQARALYQASRLVLKTVKEYREKKAVKRQANHI